jgi:alpha-L-fucosidase
MSITRRSILGTPLLAALAGDAVADDPANKSGLTQPAASLPPLPSIAQGPFRPTPESLKTYQAPAWFRDAKFGIWAHWGPQAVPRRGDWYARWMYVPGHPMYEHHLKNYGHPSEFGYKDIIPLWKAEKFDPEALMD